MKITMSVIIFFVTTIGSAQCKISLRSDNNLPIEFKLTLVPQTETGEKKILSSNDDGIIAIDQETLKKYSTYEAKFSFKHNLGIEYYRIPQFFRKTKELRHVCELQNIIAERRN